MTTAAPKPRERRTAARGRQALAFLLAASLTVATSALADTFYGEVVGLADGDTVTVLDATHHQHKVRLAGIDAPEKRQPFGNRSRESLAEMVFRKQVAVDWHKFDRYGRVIGVVRVAGRDVGLAQVRNGFAWHYKAYEREQSAADRALYSEAEREAREHKRGLWREGSPEPPWEFRRMSRNH